MIRGLKLVLRRADIAGDAGRIMLFQSLALAAGLVSSVLIARALGPAQKGIADLYVLLLSLLLEFGLLGLPAGLLYCAMTQKKPIACVHGTGLALSFLAASSIILLLLLFGRDLLPLFPGLPDWALDLMLFSVPAGLYMVVWSNLLISQDRAVRLQQFTAVFALLNLSVVLALFAIGKLDIRHFLLSSVVVSLVTAMLAFAYLRSTHGPFSFDQQVALRSMRFGLPVFFGSVANFLHFKVDQLMIGAWIGLEGVGLYALSVRWAELLFVADAALVTAALYRIGSKSPRDSRAFALDVTLIQLAISVCAALGLAALVLAGFQWLYGTAYAPSVEPLLILLPGVVFWSVSKPFSNYLNYTCGKAALVAWYSTAGLLLNLVLNTLFMRAFEMGIAGAALASSISYALVAMMIGLTVYRRRETAHVSV